MLPRGYRISFSCNASCYGPCVAGALNRAAVVYGICRMKNCIALLLNNPFFKCHFQASSGLSPLKSGFRGSPDRFLSPKELVRPASYGLPAAFRPPVTWSQPFSYSFGGILAQQALMQTLHCFSDVASLGVVPCKYLVFYDSISPTFVC